MRSIRAACIALCLSSSRALMLSRKLAKAAVVGGGVAIAAGAAGATYQRLRTDPKYDVYSPDPGSLSGKTAVVTGGTSGLGLESAKRLARAGANVVLTARTASKGAAAVEEILSCGIKNDPRQTIAYELLDLDDLDGLKVRFAEGAWGEVDVDILLNNAGVMALPQRELTVDGFERQMQSNHLGHFAFTALLAGRFREGARVVTVSSSAHQMASVGMEWDYLWKAPTYGAWRSYGQSKLANIHFARELQLRIDAAGLDWTSVALHPGVVATDLGRNLFGGGSWKGSFLGNLVGAGAKILLKSVEQGASTQVFLASGAEGQDVRGKYYAECKPKEVAEVAKNRADAQRLWKESEELSGITFDLEDLQSRQARDEKMLEMASTK